MKNVFLIYYKIYWSCWYYFNKLYYKKLGRNSHVHKQLKISRKNLECGNNVWIWKNGRIEGVLEYNNETYSPRIVFGDNVTIEQNFHLTCAEEIIIDKNTSVAANVTITDIHHVYEDINVPIELQNIKVSPVYIGEDCKIYNNAVILPGTKIGKHCTIGANSVVSGKYPDYCVIVGSPAKIVKQYNFLTKQWERIKL